MITDNQQYYTLMNLLVLQLCNFFFVLIFPFWSRQNAQSSGNISSVR